MERMSMYAWLYFDMSFIPWDSRLATQHVFVAINSQWLAELADDIVGTHVLGLDCDGWNLY